MSRGTQHLLQNYARNCSLFEKIRPQLEQQKDGGSMKSHARYRISFVILAALFFGTLAPYALHAQSTAPAGTAQAGQDQSAASTTTTKSKRKKKTAPADASASTTASGTPAASGSASASAPAAAPAASPAKAATAQTSATTATKSHSSSASTVQAQTPPSPGMVWLNTKSGVYHKSGSKWYGKTKEGKWLTEADAQKGGYKAAKD